MSIQDIFKGKNKTYKNEIVKFHKAGIESQNVYSFIPYASITRMWLGQLPPTITLKTILGVIVAIVGFYFLSFSVAFLSFPGSFGKWMLFLGVIAIVGGIIIVIKSLQSWYALNIDMASGAIYSFTANKKEHVDTGYRLLLDEINKREENRGGTTYNFGGDNNTFSGTFGPNAQQRNN